MDKLDEYYKFLAEKQLCVLLIHLTEIHLSLQEAFC